MKRLFTLAISLGLVAAMAVPATANGNQYPLYAGQDKLVGHVTIVGNEVAVALDPGWCMTIAHVHSAESLGGIPANKGGNPKVGKFEINRPYDPCVDGDTFFPGPGPFYAVHVLVSKDTNWADTVVGSNQGSLKGGGAVLSERSDPLEALVKDYTGGSNVTFFSLGFGGKLEVGFDCKVVNGAGDDLRIWEATNGSYPLEKALVKVSQDRSTWYDVGTADNTASSAASRGSSFDVGSLAWFRYVKLVDTTNPALHNNAADGFDVDGVQALQGCMGTTTAWADGGYDFSGSSWATYIDRSGS